MKQINLLPYKEQQRQQVKRMVAFGVVGLILGSGVAGGIYGSINVVVAGLKDQQLVSANTAAGKAFAVDADTAQRVAQLNALSKGEVEWDKAFALVGGIIPEGVVLSTYTYGTASSVIALKMGGTAQSNATFAGFVEALKVNKNFSAIKVDSYTYKPEDATVSFSMTATVVPQSVMYASPKPSSP